MGLPDPPLQVAQCFMCRTAVVASQICEIPRNATKIRTYSSSRSSKVIDLGVNRKRICNFQFLLLINHRLRGSASPVLTATHHSYGSLAWLSDFFFPAHLWRSDPPTDFDAKWFKQRAFTQGWYFCSKNRNFSYPLISRAPRRSKFLDLEFFR